MDSDVCHYKGFISGNLEELVQGAKTIIDTFYNENNLKDHSAYFSDVKPGRSSYAFTVWDSPEPNNLPSINMLSMEKYFKRFSYLHQQILKKLDISKPSRILFNIQLYYSPSSAVCRHFDGELMSFFHDDDGFLRITKAIRPRKVALLTLINSTKNGGTRLFSKDGSSHLVQSMPGDLLVFDNINYEHGADQPFADVVSRNDGLVRMILGWRSLDTNCLMWTSREQLVELSTQEANSAYETWLIEQWPSIYELYKLSIKKIPF